MKNVCTDCVVEEGQFHEEGCDQEICGKCGWQKLMCEHMNQLCDGKKREPFFRYKRCCARCGKLFPFKMMMVSDEEWMIICGKTYKEEDLLCIECMDFIISKRKIKINNKRIL